MTENDADELKKNLSGKRSKHTFVVFYLKLRLKSETSEPCAFTVCVFYRRYVYFNAGLLVVQHLTVERSVFGNTRAHRSSIRARYIRMV